MASYDEDHKATIGSPESPEASRQAEYDKEAYAEVTDLALPAATVNNIIHVSSILSVLVAGVALFSDGYNAQIIGYMEPLFSDL